MTRRQALRAMLAATLLVLAAFAGSAVHTMQLAPAPLPLQSGNIGATVVIGTGGLHPEDLNPKRTPALWALLRDGSSASLNLTSVNTATCPLDGWLTLSAGGRAGQPPAAGTRGPMSCPPIPRVASGFVDGWDTLVKAVADRPDDAMPGRLAQELATTGQCVSAIGPGAALGAALPGNGAVPHYRPYDPQTLTAALASCRTSLVDVGSVLDGEATSVTPADPVSHAAQVAEVDGRIARVVDAAPTGADIVVMSLADGGPQPRLGLALTAGPRFGPGWLYSPSTRQTGIVQLEDVTATVLSNAGVSTPGEVGGSVLRRSPVAANSQILAEARLGDLIDLDRSSRWVQPVIHPFFLGWGMLIVAALAALAVIWSRRLGTSDRRRVARRLTRQALVVAAAVPAPTFLANLVPWWRFAWPPAALVLAVVLWAAVLGAVALTGPWRSSVMGPPAAVAGLTFAILVADATNGSHLQIASLLGLNPIIGERFFGTGKVAFALLVAATFLLCIAVSGRLVRGRRPRVAAAAVSLIALVTVVVGAVPVWGSDVGVPLALVPGIGVLVLSILKVGPAWRRGLVIAGATLAVALVFALADWLRPPASRLPLGRLVQAVLDGEVGPIIARRAAENWDALVHTSVFTYLVPIALVALIYALARPGSWIAQPLRPLFDHVETMHPGLAGLTVSMVIGLLIHDTGAVIPLVAAALAGPLLLSVGIRLWEVRSRAATARTRAERWHS